MKQKASRFSVCPRERWGALTADNSAVTYRQPLSTGFYCTFVCWTQVSLLIVFTSLSTRVFKSPRHVPLLDDTNRPLQSPD